MTQKKEKILKGIPVSAGVAIGKSNVYKILKKREEFVSRPRIESDQVGTEIGKLLRSVSQAKATLNHHRSRLTGRTSNYHLGIFEFQSFLLEDESYIGAIKKLIEEKQITAGEAIWTVTDELAKKLKQTFEDIKDVGNLIFSGLSDSENFHLSIANPDEPFIFICDILAPSMIIYLFESKVSGIITEFGGKTSHAVILSESLGVPVIVNAKKITETAKNDDVVGMEGGCGKIVLNPSEFRIKAYKRLQVWNGKYKTIILKKAKNKAETKDSFKVKVMANIEIVSEITQAVEQGAEGIGLYRTEFIFLDNPHYLPTHREQFKIYKEVISMMNGLPVIFRIADLGSDKIPFYLESHRKIWREEMNPALGYRGIRLMHENYKELILPQLKALLRASAYGPVKIMLPMVSLVNEVKEFIEKTDEAMDELGNEAPSKKPQLGIMLETPVSILMMEKFLPYVDFFSIGTNDLTQYTLAVDRDNPQVGYIWDHMHPGVLQLVKRAIDIANKAKKEISICGESAGDPFAAAVFVGFGLKNLSVSALKVAVTKHYIRQWTKKELDEIASEVLAMDSSEDVKQYVKRTVKVGLSG
ncbi:phosphoenolpyruvate--protein phosphotransferase [candidate division WOR-3 bacterium]|nr:phosphoenolpyruvate--protein phosphotransferase [candidate division WOR-3 bacterium]